VVKHKIISHAEAESRFFSKQYRGIYHVYDIMEDVKLLNIEQKLIKMTLNRKGKEKIQRFTYGMLLA
jgi:hypothetical protein